MKGQLEIAIEKGDRFYVGYCPEVPEANGQGETIQQCRENVIQAIRLVRHDTTPPSFIPSPGWGDRT